MNKVYRLSIREPYWSKQAFGIAEHLFHDRKEIEVVCKYKNRSGDYVFPNIYKCTKETALDCERHFRGTTALRLVPVYRLSVKQYRDQKGKKIHA